jgi:metal-sulfur cluster biosynthetic enzyme
MRVGRRAKQIRDRLLRILSFFIEILEDYHGSMADKEHIKEQVIEVLKTVDDPELGIDIWNLGLVYEVDVDDAGDVKVDFTLTTMGCPIAPLIDEQIRGATQYIEGIGQVTTECVMYPPWTPEKMSPLAKSALGMV